MKALNDAALAAGRAAWNANQVHLVGSVPPTPLTPYLVVSVTSGRAENYRLCADHGSKSHRIVVQAVGDDADEIGFAVDKADAAYLDKALVVAGFDITRATSEVASPIIRDDNDLLSVTLTYPFNAYPTE